MKQALIYSLKAWLTTLLIAPLILFLIQRYNGGCKYCDSREYYWTFIGEIMGYFLLLPLISLAVILIKKKTATIISHKFLIVIIGVILTIFNVLILLLLTYLYKGLKIELYTFELLVTYSLIMGLCLWFYDLKSTSNN